MLAKRISHGVILLLIALQISCTDTSGRSLRLGKIDWLDRRIYHYLKTFDNVQFEIQKRIKQDKFSEIEIFKIQLVDEARTIWGSKSKILCLNMQQLTDYYLFMKDKPKALSALRETMPICNSSESEFAPCDWVPLLNNIALDHQELALESDAENLYIRAIDHYVPERCNQYKVPAMNNLASIWIAQAKYDQADELLSKALRIAESEQIQSILKGYTLKHLADLFRSKGRYDKSDEMYKKALEIYDQNQAYGLSMVCLNNMYEFYLEIGLRAMADKIQEQALEIRNKYNIKEKQFGRFQDSVLLLHQEKSYEQMEKLLLSMLNTSPRTEQTTSSSAVQKWVNLNNIGLSYMNQGKYDRAEDSFNQVIHEWGSSILSQSPKFAACLNNIALLYLKENREELAEQAFQRALAIFSATHLLSHPYVTDTLLGLARLRFRSGRYKEALPYLVRLFDQAEQRFRTEGLTLPEDELQALLKTNNNQEQFLYYELIDHLADETLIDLSLKVALLSKGRTLDEAIQLSRIVYTSLEEPDRQVFEHLRMLRSRISMLAYSGPSGHDYSRYERALTHLFQEANQLEESLVRRSAPLLIQRQTPGFADVVGRVAEQLPSGSVLIEVVALFGESKDGLSSSAYRYLALLLFPDGRKYALDLGSAALMDTLVQRLYHSLSEEGGGYLKDAQAVYSQLIRPLTPYLGTTHQIFFAPEGQLNLIPLSVLHDGTGFLGDKYTLHHLTSGRDLLPRHAAPAAASGITVFADPDFGAAPPKIDHAVVLAGTLTRARSFGSAALTPLPGTRQEALTLKALFPDAHVMLGAEANEPALLGLKSPKILHIATHGLFVEDEMPRPGEQGRRGFEETRVVLPPRRELRSALALAGAARSSQEKGPLVSDGLVTALEFMGLNLWGTQLVVLSACNTDRGTVELGQGVYGLRRAALAAGAETVVTALWKVSDEVTQELMKHYYTFLLQGVGRAAAMQLSAREIRKRYPHPYYWGPFVVTGRWEPLQGTK